MKANTHSLSEKIAQLFLLFQILMLSMAAVYLVSAQHVLFSVSTLPYDLYRYVAYAFFPGFYSLPVIYLISATFLLYLFFKIRNQSKFHYKITLFANIIIPIVMYLLTLNFSHNWLNFIQKADSIAQTSNYLTTTVKLLLFFNIIFIVIPLITSLLLSAKLYNSPKKQLLIKQKIIFSIYIALILIPVLGFTAFRFFQSVNKNDDYTKIQKQVPYHIYRPAYMPNGLIQTSKFFFNNSKGVNVTYGYNFFIEGELKDGFVAIAQGKKTDQFNYDDFSYIENSREGDVIQEVEVQTAKNKKGWLSIKHETNSRLYFVTPEDTNTLILSSTIEDSEFVKIADSLQ